MTDDASTMTDRSRLAAFPSGEATVEIDIVNSFFSGNDRLDARRPVRALTSIAVMTSLSDVRDVTAHNTRARRSRVRN
jgi:hypothetical protein